MNFFEIMGAVFCVILAIVFSFVIWGFFKIRHEMKKAEKESKTNDREK